MTKARYEHEPLGTTFVIGGNTLTENGIWNCVMSGRIVIRFYSVSDEYGEFSNFAVRDALKSHEELLDNEPRHPQIRRGLAVAHILLAQLHEPMVTHENHLPEAEAHYRKAFAIFADLAVESPLDPNLRKVMIGARDGFADVLSELGKTAERDK